MLKWVFCLTNIKMRHIENRSLEKCLLSYRFVNLILFHPEWRNFDWTDTRFPDTSISQTIFDTEILIFEITYFFNLVHAWAVPFFETFRVVKFTIPLDTILYFEEKYTFFKSTEKKKRAAKSTNAKTNWPSNWSFKKGRNAKVGFSRFGLSVTLRFRSLFFDRFWWTLLTS